MATSLIFELGFALPDAEPAAPGQPFKLLLLGDFSGGANPQPPAQRQARRLDIDNFDQEVARMAPTVQVALDEETFAVQPRELDDFHPDQLYQKSHAFAALRAQRERLRNPATFAQAAADLTGQPLPAPATPSPPKTEAGAVDRLVRQLIGALPPGPDPRQAALQADYVAAADAVIAARMRALLHAPGFQAVEAAWRGAHLLATSLELGDELQLHILDIGADALRADPQALRRVLVDEPRAGADGQPWSLLCCLHAFGRNDGDLRTLSALGALAAQARAPLVATYGDGGGEDDAGLPQWNALRATPQAHWLGMVALRLLLRLPYGKTTDPVTAFAFEEADAGFKHEHYLWGAGSLACACMLARAFQENGWDMTPGDVLDLADLPAHVAVHDGEARLQPCSEVLLGDQAVDAALKLGLMPLVSHRQRAAVRLPRIQSIAQPSAPLSGPWQA